MSALALLSCGAVVSFDEYGISATPTPTPTREPAAAPTITPAGPGWPVTIRTGKPNALVIFQDATGQVLAAHRSPADGVVTRTLPTRQVTIALEDASLSPTRRLITYAAIEPNDDIALFTAPPGSNTRPPIIGNLTFHLPPMPNATSYRVHMLGAQEDGDAVGTTPDGLMGSFRSDALGADGTIAIIAKAVAPDTTRYIVAKHFAAPLGPSDVTLDGAWRDPDTVSVAVSGLSAEMPPGLGLTVFVGERHEQFFYPFKLPPGLADEFVVSATAWTLAPETRTEWTFQNRVAVSSSVAVDFARLAPLSVRLAAGDPRRPVVSWGPTVDGAIGAIVEVAYGPSGFWPGTVQWTLVEPPTASMQRMPDVPAEIQAWLPAWTAEDLQQRTHLHVDVLDGDALAGFAALERAFQSEVGLFGAAPVDAVYPQGLLRWSTFEK